MSVEVLLFLLVAGGVFTSYAVVTSRLDLQAPHGCLAIRCRPPGRIVREGG